MESRPGGSTVSCNYKLNKLIVWYFFLSASCNPSRANGYPRRLWCSREMSPSKFGMVCWSANLWGLVATSDCPKSYVHLIPMFKPNVFNTRSFWYMCIFGVSLVLTSCIILKEPQLRVLLTLPSLKNKSATPGVIWLGDARDFKNTIFHFDLRVATGRYFAWGSRFSDFLLAHRIGWCSSFADRIGTNAATNGARRICDCWHM